jgi:hypothetical protein
MMFSQWSPSPLPEEESEDKNKGIDTDNVAINFEDAKEEEPGDTPVVADNVDNLLTMMTTLSPPNDEKKEPPPRRLTPRRLKDMDTTICSVIVVGGLFIMAVFIILLCSIRQVPENEVGLKYKKYSRVRVPIPVSI